MALSGVYGLNAAARPYRGGTDQSDVVASARQKTQWISELESRAARGKAPMNSFALAAKKTKPIKQGSFSILEDDFWLDQGDIVSSSGTAITMTAGDENIFRVNDTVMIADNVASRTRITAIDTSTHVITTADDISSYATVGKSLQAMSDTQAEGFDFANIAAMYVEPNIVTGYLQQSTQKISMSQRMIHSENFGSPELAKSLRDAMDHMVTKREKSILFGKESSTKDAWITSGIYDRITTNTVTATGNVLTENNLWSLFQKVARRNSDKQSIVFFVGDYVMSYIHTFLSDKVQGSFSDTTLGVDVTKIKSPYLPDLKIVLHPLLSEAQDAAGTWPGYGFLVQTKNFKLAYHSWTGELTKMQKIQSPGSTREDYGFVSDWGVVLIQEVTHGLLTGVGNAYS
jgi:hypothetical protein